MVTDTVGVSSKKISILLVEDYALLREALRSLLMRESHLELVGEAGNDRDAFSLAVLLQPCVALIGISTPSKNGPALVRDIKKHCANTKVVALANQASEEWVHETLKAGVNGYALKSDSHAELMMAIRCAMEGKLYLSPSISHQIVSGYLDRPAMPRSASGTQPLTYRELQIIKLIAEGRQNKEIAKFLSISPKTVEKHRSNLMKKLNRHNSSQLTAYALENGLLIREVLRKTEMPTAER